MFRITSLLLLVLVGIANASFAGHTRDRTASSLFRGRGAQIVKSTKPLSLELRGKRNVLSLRGGEHQYGLRYSKLI